MSDAFLRHNWHLLVNPIWSPLYPFLIGLATWLTRPSAQCEVIIVHVLNCVIFVGALASFEFLLRQVISVLGLENAGNDKDSVARLPLWTWQLLGYSVFAWSTLGMIWAPRMISPDLCVAIFVYLDAGLLLRLRAGAERSRTCLLLGLTLGLGYLAKAILFPMAFVFMAIALFMIREWRKAVLHLAATCFVFGAISAPLLISMSSRVGRPSYSEAGNLNYVWHVNGFNPYLASPPPYLKHPMTLFHRSPNVFGFREPIAYTYPPRQDMEYWSAGVTAVITVGDQLRAIGTNLGFLFADYHIVPMWGLIGLGLIVVLTSSNTSRRFEKVVRSWPLFVSGVAAPMLYLLVNVEPRYVAPFLLLVLLGLFPGIFLQDRKDIARRAAISAVVISSFLMLLTALIVSYHLAGFSTAEDGALWLQIGKSLNTAGVRPGEEVAIIGDSSDGCRWARMARVRIVAQILRADVSDFWRVSGPGVKAEVYDAFARAGAKAVVAEDRPPSGRFADWQRLGDTHYYVHFLAPLEKNVAHGY